MKILIKKLQTLGILLLALILSVNVVSASGYTVGANASSYNVGSTVKVTVTFSAPKIIGVQASVGFDSAVLKGPNRIYFESDSQDEAGLKDTYTTTLQFTTLKSSAATTITIDNVKVGTATEFINMGQKSVTVKVSAPTPPSTTTKPPTQTPTTPKPTAPVEPEPDPMDDAIEVTFGSEKLYLWPKLTGVKVPEGFEKGESTYGEDSLEVVTKEPLALAYLTDEEGENGAFWNYDEKEQSFYPYIKISTQSTYVFLQPGEDVVVPEGYEETSVTIDEQTLNGWAIDDPELKDFVLLYALNNEAEEGFYLYDKVEGTMQRYGERIVEVEVEVEVEPEPQTITQQIFGNPILAGIFSGLGLLAAGLAAALIRVIQKNKRNFQ
ncbi:hypothetical protein J0B03_09040 [Alkalibacter rhizosphaerae]|uniref:Cohesin domain-containing protein n=1 Tax=Alkalibacter rhizosphaerae TaxID=2815577 RepID=A0A974XDX3_9FIRM|nr:hypothetical protein [Alkalibacter rhizosphaerae]QSX07946.1 hypothetical protein J0B03_09040 [Alkalibacter rhizosphaerae]